MGAMGERVKNPRFLPFDSSEKNRRTAACMDEKSVPPARPDSKSVPPLDTVFVPQAIILLMEEIPNNHLGCMKPCK